jgi:hypothetical protein
MLQENKDSFIKDNFYVDGVFVCKFISSKYSEELKKKISKEKLKFDLVNNPVNLDILNLLKNKELYFLKKTVEAVENIKYPLHVKTFLDDNGDIIIENINIKDTNITLKKKYLEKTEVCSSISDKVSSITLKVDLDMAAKNIKDLKASSTKLSIIDIMELIKSENLKLKVQIKCSAVYKENGLYISGTLTKISLDGSKMAQIYKEIKEKDSLDPKSFGSNNSNSSVCPINKIEITKYPTKASIVVDNIVLALTGQSTNTNLNKKYEKIKVKKNIKKESS